MKSSRTPRLAVSLLVVVACGSPPPPARPATVDVTLPEPATAPKEIDPREAVKPPVLDGPDAPWLEQPMATDKTYAFWGRMGPVGLHTAVVRAGAGNFVVHSELGVLGTLKAPAKPVWIGVAGPDDAIYMATEDDAFYRAKDPRAAVTIGGLEPRPSQPGAVAWSAGGGVVACAVGSEVRVSFDEGRTFTSSVPAAGYVLKDVLTRYDGMLVATAVPATKMDAPRRAFLSRDKGKTWQVSPFHPQTVYHQGAWLWNGDDACPAVLSADGRQWSTRVATAPFVDRNAWERWISISDALVATTKADLVTSVDPPAPTSAAPATGTLRPCKALGSTQRGMLSVLDSAVLGALSGGVDANGLIAGFGLSTSGHGSESSKACRGAACLVQATAASAAPRTQFSMFGDALCEEKDASAATHACKPGAPLTRLPTFAILDRETGAINAVQAPLGCRPRRVLSAGGIGILLCELDDKGATAIFVAAAYGVWHAEGALRASPDSLAAPSIAADGTLLMASDDGTSKIPARVFARSPKALGTPEAWRDVTTPRAMAYRVLRAGAVLIATSSAESSPNELFDMILARDGEPPLTLAARLSAPGDVVSIDVDRGRLLVRVLPGFGIATASELARASFTHPVKDLVVTLGGQMLPLEQTH